MDWDEYLREAYRSTDFEQIEYALEQGADSNVDIGWHGNTILYWAASGGWLDLVRLLLRFGAQVAREPEGDSTSLHVSVERSERDILALLLAADGRDAIDRYDYLARTPLMLAAMENNLELAAMLIAAGADVNAHYEARIGSTALKIAAECSDAALVKLLLDAGADPLIPGWMQRTAWDEAQNRGSAEGRRVRDLIERALPIHTRTQPTLSKRGPQHKPRRPKHFHS